MDKSKKIVSCFFVALFISYYAGVTMFSHSHIIKGAAIIHSHFHPDSHHDTQSGNHTEQCITLIDQISHFQYIEFSCSFVLKPLEFQLHKEMIIHTACWAVPIHLETHSLRAPPVLV